MNIQPNSQTSQPNVYREIKKNIFANDVNENEYNAFFSAIQQYRTCMNSNKRFAAAFFCFFYVCTERKSCCCCCFNIQDYLLDIYLYFCAKNIHININEMWKVLKLLKKYLLQVC